MPTTTPLQADSAHAADRTPSVPAGGTALFFAVAIAICWLGLLPVVLARLGVIPGPAERYVAGAPFAVFSPMLAAILAARLERGGPGVRAIFRPVRTWRVGVVWYLAALGLPGACLVAGAAVYKLLGGSGEVRLLFLPDNAQYIAAALIVPIGEEFGWRGFALPRLQKRFGALTASVILGVGWGVWHIPQFIMADILSPGTLAILVAFFVPGSILYTWVYNHTRGSMLIALLMHVGAHLNNAARSLPGNTTPIVIHAVSLVVVACALVLVDRKAWRSAPAADLDANEGAARVA
jgi:membrane protease YdiL (CAAX protease family)